MSQDNYGQPGNEGVAHESIQHATRKPYWRRAHRSWVFWLALFLMLAAMTIYVLSDNLTLLPWGQRPQGTLGQ